MGSTPNSTMSAPPFSIASRMDSVLLPNESDSNRLVLIIFREVDIISAKELYLFIFCLKCFDEGVHTLQNKNLRGSSEYISKMGCASRERGEINCLQWVSMSFDQTQRQVSGSCQDKD